MENQVCEIDSQVMEVGGWRSGRGRGRGSLRSLEDDGDH